MTSSVALPLMLAHITSQGHANLLHSKQSPAPLLGTMRINGITAEQGKVFLTRRAVNQFYNDIGLSMRRGTGCFSKAIKPAEVDGLKDLLTYRLLFLMVHKIVPPELVFQFDETGCSLLPFSKRGRAQRGCKEVRFFGMDDKRQFTLTPVIDGLNKLIFPTQMIWAGTEILKIGDRGHAARRPGFAGREATAQEDHGSGGGERTVVR